MEFQQQILAGARQGGSVIYKNLCTKEDEEGIETMIPNITNLSTWKEEEKNLWAKEENKYFWSKEVDSKLYEQVMDCMNPYLLDNKLKILQHLCNSQLNKVVNNLISSYAPKIKTCCCTMLMSAWVVIIAAVQGLGYREF